MVCRDKEIQTILGCLITSRIRQESELLVIIDVEANTVPCISLVQVCVDILFVLVLCPSFAAANTSPVSSCVWPCRQEGLGAPFCSPTWA